MNRLKMPRLALKSTLVLNILFAAAGMSVAQPELTSFLMLEPKQTPPFRLDVYVEVDTGWLAQVADSFEVDDARFQLDLATGDGSLVARQVWDFGKLSQLQLGTAETALKRSVSFQPETGPQRLRLKVTGGGQLLYEVEHAVEVNATGDDVQLSDLVPVDFPKLERPPFSDIFRVDEHPDAFNFLLYYEVSSMTADTTVSLHSTIADANGRVWHEETYTLSLYGRKRHDYLRVDLDRLPAGSFVVRLAVEGGGVAKSYHFNKEQAGLFAPGANQASALANES